MYSPKYSKAQSCAYFCSKNVLVALNALYIAPTVFLPINNEWYPVSLIILELILEFIALVLIGIAVYAKTSAKITSLPILGGVVACGVFLLLVAVLGVVGAVRHNQVILFFYMIIMSLLFIIQMSVSIAAVAISHDQQASLMEAGWNRTSDKVKNQIQSLKDCCGFKNKSLVSDSSEDPGVKALGHPSCKELTCCLNSDDPCPDCNTCYDALEDVVNHLLKVAGGVGLFFSFTLLFGVYMTCRYRNQKDPRANPGAFL